MNEMTKITLNHELRAIDSMKNLDAIKFFNKTSEYWSLMLNVIDTYYKGSIMTKSDLLEFLDCSYKTKNTYIKKAISNKYFVIKNNPKDKRSVIITPSAKMLSQFKKYSSLVN